MGLDELLAALGKPKTIQDHPDWEAFKQQKMPAFISFYYTNQHNQEAYWDHARIIKVELKNMLLIVEGAHQDPLRFEIAKIMHCKNAQTGENAQDLWFELLRMKREIAEMNASG